MNQDSDNEEDTKIVETRIMVGDRVQIISGRFPKELREADAIKQLRRKFIMQEKIYEE